MRFLVLLKERRGNVKVIGYWLLVLMVGHFLACIVGAMSCVGCVALAPFAKAMI